MRYSFQPPPFLDGGRKILIALHACWTVVTSGVIAHAITKRRPITSPSLRTLVLGNTDAAPPLRRVSLSNNGHTLVLLGRFPKATYAYAGVRIRHTTTVTFHTRCLRECLP